MIIDLAGLSIEVDVKEDSLGQIEGELKRKFEDFISPDTYYNFSLMIFTLPYISLHKILSEDDERLFKDKVNEIEGRLPFQKLGYKWGSNLSGNRAFKRIYRKSPSYISEIESREMTNDMTVVPHRNSLLLIDHKNRRGDVFVSGRGVSEYVLSIPLAIQAAMSLILPKSNDIIFHASSAKINGSGLIFFGASGAGKSTIAASFPKEDVMADDSALCLFRDGKFSVGPTPFTQVSLKNSKKERPPLKGLFFLVKDKVDFFTPISPGTAMVKILHSHIHFFRYFEENDSIRVFTIIEKLVRQVPSYELHFTLDFDPRSLSIGDFS